MARAIDRHIGENTRPGPGSPAGGTPMDFAYSDKVKALQERVLRFMDEHIYPNELRFNEEVEENTRKGQRWTPLTEELAEGTRAGAEPVVAEGGGGEPQ
jgi:alkylation response protein AidB-like acyl-CoA dehydrogenase